MFVVKDLVVDMANFYAQYKSVKPWLQSGDAEKVDVEDGPAEDEVQDLSGAELPFAWITGRVRTAFAFLKPANVRKSTTRATP